MREVSIDEAARALGCKRGAVAPRLLFLGYGESCRWCGGQGVTGRGARRGVICDGCRGGGVRLPRLTRRLLVEARARVERGELAPYFETVRRRRVVRELLDSLGAFVADSLVFRTCTANARNSPRGALQQRLLAMSAAYQRAASLADELARGAVAPEAAFEEAWRLVETALAAEMTEEEVRAAGFEPPGRAAGRRDDTH